jgi:hypothetical protein
MAVPPREVGDGHGSARSALVLYAQTLLEVGPGVADSWLSTYMLR